MAASVVVDAGPIISWLDAGEPHHEWVRAQVGALRRPLLTCEAALSEAAHVVSRAGHDAALVPELVARGMLAVSPWVPEESAEVAALMRRYASVPMSFADACLVRLVERTPNATLLTLDEDFTVYRQQRRRVIPLLAPWQQ